MQDMTTLAPKLFVLLCCDDPRLQVGDRADTFFQAPLDTGLIGFPIELIGLPVDPNVCAALQKCYERPRVAVGEHGSWAKTLDRQRINRRVLLCAHRPLHFREFVRTDVELARLEIGWIGLECVHVLLA